MKIGDFLYWFGSAFIFWFFSNNIAILGVSPDFIFIAAYTAAIIAGPFKAMSLCFLFGAFLDVYSWGHFGVFPLIYSCLAYLVYNLKFKIDLFSPFPRVMAFLITQYLVLFGYSFLTFMILKNPVLNYKVMIFQPLFSVLFLEFFFSLAYRLKKMGGFWL